MSKQTVKDINVRNKKVLVRADFNVPFEKGTTAIPDDSRIVVTLPTICYLMENKARIILCSHLGRPRGKVVEEMRLAPVAKHLSMLLDSEVAYVENCVGSEVEEVVRDLKPGGVLLLENLRFHPGEEENDPSFAKALASLAEVYVNDAFGTAHRAHASIVGVTKYLPAVAGILMERELEMLGKALRNPPRPFAAITGGAKISDKMAVLENLLNRVDVLLIGGGMAATFLKSKSLEVGMSLLDPSFGIRRTRSPSGRSFDVEEAGVEFAGSLLRRAQQEGSKILLPIDVTVAETFSAGVQSRVVAVNKISPSDYIMDIGPETISLFEEELKQCRTVLWNGPMGVFEWEPFGIGTMRITQTLAGLPNATTVVGGGSTAAAVASLGLASKMTHVSTGGGASLQFLEGRALPGVAALPDKIQ